MRPFHHTARQRTTTRKATILSLCVGALWALASGNAAAQYTPIVSGGLAFLTTTNAGQHSFQPVFAPVVVAPLGPHFLVESRFDYREFVARNGKDQPYTGTFFKSIPFLQLDYIAAPKLTVAIGRYIVPFGIYNERLSAVWQQNFQAAPTVAAIGTRTTGSGDGAMLRGVAFTNAKVHVDYAAYFSVASNIGQFQAARAAGDRVDVFFPGKRIEIGTSYARFLQGTHNNSWGTHFVWLPWRVPLQVHSEYAHAEHSQGYWMEASYRLSQFGGRDSAIGRLEPLFRMQQTFRNSPGPGDGLPGVDTKQADFGFDYHLPREVRINTGYSRKFVPTGNANLWFASMTYRFLFPAWKGHK